MLNAPPILPSPRTRRRPRPAPAVSMSPVMRQPAATKVGAAPIWSSSRRLGISLMHGLREFARLLAAAAPARIPAAPAGGEDTDESVRACVILVSVACWRPASGCSHEQRDWHAAQSADTIEAYEQFVEAHPKSSRATDAQTRIVAAHRGRATGSARAPPTRPMPTGSFSRASAGQVCARSAHPHREFRSQRRCRGTARRRAAAEPPALGLPPHRLRRTVRARHPRRAARRSGNRSGLRHSAWRLSRRRRRRSNGSDSPRATNQSSMAPSPMLSAARAKAGTMSIACGQRS